MFQAPVSERMIGMVREARDALTAPQPTAWQKRQHLRALQEPRPLQLPRRTFKQRAPADPRPERPSRYGERRLAAGHWRPARRWRCKEGEGRRVRGRRGQVEEVEGQRGSGGEGFGSSIMSLLPWFYLLTWPLPRPSHPSTTAPPRTSFPLLPPWRRLRPSSSLGAELGELH